MKNTQRQAYLRKYARLLIRMGLNLEKGQPLLVHAPVECADFARLCAEEAFEAGAGDVTVNWGDDRLSRLRYLQAPDTAFEQFPEWKRMLYMDHLERGAAVLSISASDPDYLNGVNPERIQSYTRIAGEALKPYRTRMMNSETAWCVASIPTAAWAQKIFPESDVDEAVARLWEAIFSAVRIDDGDPVAAWERHLAALQSRTAYLNEKAFVSLHYTASNGTDLTIELPKGHVWQGGSEPLPNGRPFVANMPTEEVFTAPLKTGVNGRVFSTKPLSYNGVVIEDFEVTFKDGRVVAYHAKKGEAQLKALLDTDANSVYLGEVALVPHRSPISDMNLLFYNTLFDENASCHLAFGEAYPTCLEGGQDMDEKALEHAGLNQSITHEDFMVGTSDLTITGRTEAGEEIAFFVNGAFIFE